MLALLGGALVAASAAIGGQAQPPAADNSCAGDPNCRQASAGELFAAADAAADAGDLEAAENILKALTADPVIELRTEARFRLASIRERRGDLDGAVAALRELLAEKPDANRARLELGRILTAQGDHAAARRIFARATEAGLPPDVARTVRRYSTALASLKRRGGSIDVTVGPDSNVNRATGDRFIDTIIAPFELDADARNQRGIGITAASDVYSRNKIFGIDLLTRAGLRAEFFPDLSRFNDIQFFFSTGPELSTPLGQIRPAFLHERRWFGGDRYSVGYGGGLNWQLHADAKSRLQIDAAITDQDIRPNPFLSGTRYSLGAAYDRAFTEETSGRISLRAAQLDAATRPDSLRQFGGDMLLAHIFGRGTVFGSAAYTRTDGLAPIFLFGRTRHDDRVDLAAGFIARERLAGFAPLVRFSYTASFSSIELYDYRRAKLEFGFTREF